MRPSARAAVVVGIAAAVGAAAAPASPAAVRIDQLVVQKDGSARQKRVKANATQVKVHGDRCAVPGNTALAALVASRAPKLRLHDYGACSGKPRDAGGLFVRSMGGDANRGTDGWVYKVGNRLATAGAADPTGPFGHGRLKKGQRVTWLYCHMNVKKHSCQRTLALTAQPGQDETIHVHVKAYDDQGHGKPAGAATVHAGSLSAKTDSHGDADLVVPPGRYSVYAEKHGEVRSFGEEVDVGA